MTYTPPTTRIAGNKEPSSDFNRDVTENIKALYNRPYAASRLDLGADKTTTSTSFVDIDSTNLNLALTLDAPGNVLVGFTGSIAAIAGTALIFLDITLDGTRQGLDDGIVGERNNNNVLPGNAISLTYLLTNVAAGAHAIRIQWKVSANSATLYAGAGTVGGDLHPQFWAAQI